MTDESRRPVKTRESHFFQKLAARMIVIGLTPNQVSVASAAFSFVGLMVCFKSSDVGINTSLLVLIVMIQLRLVCNLIDGLMAVEGGLKTPTGEIFNDLPDRFSDTFLIVGAAVLIDSDWGLHLGLLTSIMAMLTAYIRQMGAVLTGNHDFKGPMAKQHRMFVLALFSLLTVASNFLYKETKVFLVAALFVMLFGSAFTCLRRLRGVSKFLNSN